MNQEQREQEVVRLANAWAAAELQSDAASLERQLAEDFVGIGPLGFLLTKQEWLDRLQSGDLKYNTLTLNETRVRVYNNDAAIVICRQIQDAAYRGNPINAQLRTTLVFVQQHGQWQLAGLHFCNIGQPPPFARS